MLRIKNSVWVCSFWIALLSSCQNANVKSESEEPVDSEASSTRPYLIGDSIKITVPESWEEINGDNAQFVLKEQDCERPFCENMVVYSTDDVNQYSRLELGEVFIQSLSANYENFRLIHSDVSTPDSSKMSFDYLLTSNNVKLGGTAYIYVKGDKAVVFSFMGYNGDEGDYVAVRKKVTDIMGSLEFL